MKLIHPRGVDTADDHAAVRKNLGIVGVLEDQALLASQRWYAEHARWRWRVAAEIDLCSVARPADIVEFSCSTIMRQHCPTRRSWMHDGDLVLAIDHRMKGECLAIGRDSRPERNIRTAELHSGPG